MTRARDVANLIGSGNYSSTTFTATAGQTAFTISHTQGFIQVFMNGLLLDETADYTSNGSAVTLTSGAAAGDEIEVVAYNTFSVGDALNQAAADTRYVNTTGDTMTGNLTVDTQVGIGSSPMGVETLTVAKSSGTPTIRVNAPSGSEAQLKLQANGGGTTIPMIAAKTDGSLSFSRWTGAAYTERMKIDSSGRVTKPNQPAFVFQGSYNNWTTINQSGTWLPFTGNTAVATSTNNELAMNWTSSKNGGYNPSGNGINATTGVYTAPVAGVYVFNIQCYVLKVNAGNDYYHINSYVNGTNSYDYTIYGYGMAGTTYSTPEITKVVKLAANDTFAFRLYTNTAAAFKILPDYATLSAYLLS